MRKMATVRRIDAIEPIAGADAIEVATVGGWKVVIKKGEFAVGDLAIYLEIDSWVPHDLAPFLSKGTEPREYNGVKGERLRTIKLRGQVSQGLLLKPAERFLEKVTLSASNDALFGVGDDVSEALNIQKYEPPIPAQLAGEVRGLFPSFIRKTDQERIQNLTRELEEWREQDDLWEVTEKLDGSSMTVYMKDGEVGVCSRNLDLKFSETNSFWKAAVSQGIIDVLKKLNWNIAIQGELIGEGIQKNPYKIRGQQFLVFDIFDINKQEYFDPNERRVFCSQEKLTHVPLVSACLRLLSTDAILRAAEAKSTLNIQTEREGLVFKRTDGKVSFKAISNKFLLKGGE